MWWFGNNQIPHNIKKKPLKNTQKKKQKMSVIKLGVKK